jgi:hypothetical protein
MSKMRLREIQLLVHDHTTGQVSLASTQVPGSQRLVVFLLSRFVFVYRMVNWSLIFKKKLLLSHFLLDEINNSINSFKTPGYYLVNLYLSNVLLLASMFASISKGKKDA